MMFPPSRVRFHGILLTSPLGSLAAFKQAGLQPATRQTLAPCARKTWVRALGRFSMIRIGRTAIVLTLLLAGSAFAQQQPPAPSAAPPPVDFSKFEIKTTDLGDNVYMLEGQGGNITVAVGKTGIIMVDGQFAPLHDKIKAAISTISSLPIKYLINTHYHGDHTGGNEAFAKDGAIVVSDINVKLRLAEGTTNGLTGVKTP